MVTEGNVGGTSEATITSRGFIDHRQGNTVRGSQTGQLAISPRRNGGKGVLSQAFGFSRLTPDAVQGIVVPAVVELFRWRAVWCRALVKAGTARQRVSLTLSVRRRGGFPGIAMLTFTEAKRSRIAPSALSGVCRLHYPEAQQHDAADHMREQRPCVGDTGRDPKKLDF